MRPHFESIEVQDERRQRQPQIIQFFNAGIVPVFHGEFAYGLRRTLSRSPPRVDIPSAETGGVHATFNGRGRASAR